MINLVMVNEKINMYTIRLTDPPKPVLFFYLPASDSDMFCPYMSHELIREIRVANIAILDFTLIQ